MIAEHEFRQVMGRFATGVTIVTTRAGGIIHGLTANAFCSVSLAPPLVLVCVNKAAQSHDLIRQGGCFAVSILAASQRAAARRFAREELPARERFADLRLRTAITGAPILEECLAWLDCRLVATHEGGDHTIFVGEVVALGQNADLPPLLYFRGSYHTL
ncbi:MAG: flavin reductase family protein [candidate division KSB1 bacterium]|nr:flavin reductase family protein [candidate division KSB1 bacterium]MDZ7272959.1 flavin reductase family protein [candidate division KSB1 bacterium]MDZ7285063.1 flavin reductase family protein [candidate division KSB1 bacterium]MDZ7298095.1 flavin reductase family protein [candidate division KSB1 bacterium]MDZ7308228.1 flavin reductase family protein [candidate division KSB1 bacterium]